jgi:hypothetical protein
MNMILHDNLTFRQGCVNVKKSGASWLDPDSQASIRRVAIHRFSRVTTLSHHPR